MLLSKADKKEVLVIKISRHCSEQIVARQGEVKGKRANVRKEREVFFIFLLLR